tara:strand:- start:2182 stop:3693 length:1512 start_codon:yes stop_codon:yes gene_type:complete
MSLNQEKYEQLCETCDHILEQFADNIPISSLPWLHVLNEHPTNLIKYSFLWEERIAFKEYLRKEIYFFVIYFFYSLIASILIYPFNKKKKNSALKTDIVFFSHIFKASQIDDEEDFYFGNIPYLLKQNNITSQIILQNHSRVPTLFLSKRLRKKNQRFKSFLNMPSFLICIKSFIELTKSYLKLKKQIKMHPEPFIKRVLKEASIQTLSIQFFEALVFNYLLQDLLLKTKSKIVIITLEGHAKEKMLFFNSRKVNEEISCIGYQHTILFPKQNSIFRYSNPDFLPDIIFTSGKINEEVIRDKLPATKKIQIQNIGSHRISNKKRPIEAQSFKKNCLFLPDGNIEDLKIFSKFISQIHDEDFTFTVRLHPAFKLEELKKKYKLFLKYPKNISFSSQKNINKDFEKSNWVVYRGSGAAIFAIQNGLRPIYLKSPKESLSIDPLNNISNGKKIISTYSDLINIINFDRSLSIKEFNNQLDEIKRYGLEFFEPLNFPKILSKVKKNL